MNRTHAQISRKGRIEKIAHRLMSCKEDIWRQNLEHMQYISKGDRDTHPISVQFLSFSCIFQHNTGSPSLGYSGFVTDMTRSTRRRASGQMSQKEVTYTNVSEGFHRDTDRKVQSYLHLG